MIKAIDLFAGAGGLSYGFLMTGEYCFVAAAEINENARQTYKNNIAKNKDDFEFIKNVIGYDFEALNTRLGGSVDVVIGGPPCQGFSNANRQKNRLISTNNNLIKEFFRAIRLIRPKAFVMENVRMLVSDKHRFYESRKDCQEIDALIAKGYDIPKRKDTLLLSKADYDGIDFSTLSKPHLEDLSLTPQLTHLLKVLRKNIGNPRRLPTFLKKNTNDIKSLISFCGNVSYENENRSELKRQLLARLQKIKDGIETNQPESLTEDLDYILGLQRLTQCIIEITENELIGQYEYSADEGLRFTVNSYSVIDYINAILGDEYIQKGNVLNAEWFGVPQERNRYIVIGIRRDIYNDKGIDLVLPNGPVAEQVPTVGEAILDLTDYDAGYESVYTPLPYDVVQNRVSEYARRMREGSDSVKNHIATKTTEKIMTRFKKIEQGMNFHSLSMEDKDTYSNPGRTQNTIYLRLDPKRPSKTVVNVRKSMWIHPVLDRAVTVREAARLQSFPDSFEFFGPKDSQYQQVGNAVPPLLAKEIAFLLLQYLK